jgi:uncharacterized protein (DUF427 family)
MIPARPGGVTLAESDPAELVEGDIYFPPDRLTVAHFERTRSHSLCPWKEIFRHYSVTVGDRHDENAVWTYLYPSPLARDIKNHVPFWPFVDIEVDEPDIPDGKERM